VNAQGLDARIRSARVIVFCRVVDHFGDAGFCWRLCVALRAHGAVQVILVIDRVNILNELRGAQQVPGVTVLPWHAAQTEWEVSGVPPAHQADVLIEAFACNPPAVYIRALPPTAQWLTLDYLATEPWADDVHGQLSPVPTMATPIAAARRWVVPGFSSGAGGLLHGQWRHLSSKERRAWRKQLAGHALSDDTFLVMAFGYADAPWSTLEALLAKYLPPGFQRFHLWRPKGIEYSQAQFDEILQACDLNFVRGEDSFIRAHWAAAGPWQVPFVWQPYRQEQEAHRHKLAGWMHQMIRHPALGALESFHWAWNGLSSLPDAGAHKPWLQAPLAPPAPGNCAPLNALQLQAITAAWPDLAADWGNTQAQLHQACLALAGRPSLEENLLGILA
jgi:hypothetical protein